MVSGAMMMTHLLLVHAAAVRPGDKLPRRREADFVIPNFRFASGETLPELRIHYRTLGKPGEGRAGCREQRRADHARHGRHRARSSSGAALPASCSGRGSRSTPRSYFIVLPDDIGHGKSSKPSDGLRAKFPRYGYRDMVDGRASAADRRPRRESPAARHGHVDGRHAHVALGRDAIPISWTR